MSSNAAPSKLFESFNLSPSVQLQHRIVFAPCTRLRSTKWGHTPIVPLVKTYYEQRASTPGTLLITEATLIGLQGSGFVHNPGVWNEEQINAWKEVTDAVHAQGSYIFLQIWALGRAANPAVISQETGLPAFQSYVSSSPTPFKSRPQDVPRELTKEEIKKYVELFAQAAKNAVYGAGFDGVELHGANGYLLDQFLQDVTNKRTDEYGGSIENRSRFGLEVIQAVVKEVGEERVGYRLSPWSTFQEMRMADPKPQFSHFVTEIKSRHPKFAYIHVTEPRVGGSEDRITYPDDESNDFIRELWAPRPLISAGGYNRDIALQTAEEKGDLIAFGRFFISNPDLPLRIKNNVPLTAYDRKTFYTPGESENTAVGYITYPFAKSDVASSADIQPKYNRL